MSAGTGVSAGAGTGVANGSVGAAGRFGAGEAATDPSTEGVTAAEASPAPAAPASVAAASIHTRLMSVKSGVVFLFLRPDEDFPENIRQISCDDSECLDRY
jgi:hypothetical protein